MAERIERIFEYSPLMEGKTTRIDGGTAGSARTCVLYFNSAGPCDVYIRAYVPIPSQDEDTGEVSHILFENSGFLGRVDGLRTIEVAVSGSFEIAFETAQGYKNSKLWFRTNSGSVVHRENDADEIFTEMYERTAIDPAWLEYKALVETNARRNEERLLGLVEQRIANAAAAIKKPVEKQPEQTGTSEGGNPPANPPA